MSEIRAFRGWRYDLGRVGSLSDVVAPPYDIIDTAMQNSLYERSPYNAIRVELTREEVGDNENNNRYGRASQTISEWMNQHILVQDTLRNLYLYEQEFQYEGNTYIRQGFFARVRLEPLETGSIFPHELTHSGPKADRLKLYHATGMNISPIFSLYPDPDGEVIAPLLAHTMRNLPLVATDHEGVISRWWPITDEKVVSQVVGLMSPRPLFIADGHHRYETGLRYLEEMRAKGQVTSDDHPAHFTLMYLVGMSAPGLIVMPTHRLISGIPDLSVDQLTALIKDYFHIKIIGKGTAASEEAWELVQTDDSPSVMAIHTNLDDTWVLLHLTDPEMMQKLAPEHSEEWQGLGVSILHRLLLETILPQAFGVPGTCRYVHLVKEVNQAIENKECTLAILVPPASLENIESIAGNREKMPQKSTYFYPKVITGAVMNSLKVN